MNDIPPTRIRAIIATVLGVPDDLLLDSTGPNDLERWDSFAQLNIMLAVEDEYGVQLEPDDVEAMRSVAAIVDLVRQRAG